MEVVICPHCKESIIIEEINCAIFRHAVLKINNQQINPHSSKDICDDLIEKKLIYGCGKPFQLIKKDNKLEAVICEYI
jgi:RNA-binding protein YhbY